MQDAWVAWDVVIQGEFLISEFEQPIPIIFEWIRFENCFAAFLQTCCPILKYCRVQRMIAASASALGLFSWAFVSETSFFRACLVDGELFSLSSQGSEFRCRPSIFLHIPLKYQIHCWCALVFVETWKLSALCWKSKTSLARQTSFWSLFCAFGLMT